MKNYLEKFEKNILDDKINFKIFMRDYPEKIKDYILKLKIEYGKNYLKSHYIEAIWDYYKKSIKNNGILDEIYINKNILNNLMPQELNARIEKKEQYVFTEAETYYLITGHCLENDFEKKVIQWEQALLEKKNMVTLKIAPMFMKSALPEDVLIALSKKFIFEVPKDMELICYFETNALLINKINKKQLIKDCQKFLKQSNEPLYDISNFLMSYCSFELDDVRKHNLLDGKNNMQYAFYSILCEENALNELIKIKANKADVKYYGLESINLSLLLNFFNERILNEFIKTKDYCQVKKCLTKVFVEICNAYMREEKQKSMLTETNKGFFKEVLLYLKNNEDEKIKLNLMFIEKMYTNDLDGLKELYILRNQIELYNMSIKNEKCSKEKTSLFWSKIEEQLMILKKGVFDSNTFRSILTRDSFADFIIIFGNDFYSENNKMDLLFNYLNDNIDDLFDIVVINGKEKLNLKGNALNDLIKYEKEYNY